MAFPAVLPVSKQGSRRGELGAAALYRSLLYVPLLEPLARPAVPCLFNILEHAMCVVLVPLFIPSRPIAIAVCSMLAGCLAACFGSGLGWSVVLMLVPLFELGIAMDVRCCAPCLA